MNDLKTYLIIVGIGVAIWFFKDYQYQKSENLRQSENIEQIRRYDSLKYASQHYTKKELDEYLEYSRKDLQSFLKAHRIANRRIERIITQKLSYQDNTVRKVNLKPILEAIKDERNLKVPIIDSTDCLIVKGFVVFNNDTLSLDITDRKFKNASDVVTHWERNQWRFLGIKTRLFGKRKVTVTIKDACGETKTLVIDKK